MLTCLKRELLSRMQGFKDPDRRFNFTSTTDYFTGSPQSLSSFAKTVNLHIGLPRETSHTVYTYYFQKYLSFYGRSPAT